MNFSAGSNPVQQADQLEQALASALDEPCSPRNSAACVTLISEMPCLPS